MELGWKITASDVRVLKEFVRTHRRNEFVRRRVKRNVRNERPRVRIDRFWKALLGCLLTTQQRSGPDSAVAEFLRVRPFPLTYRRCTAVASPRRMILQSVKRHGGIRRAPTIANQAVRNLRLLRDGDEWRQTLRKLRRLEKRHRSSDERSVAHYLDRTFAGLGPKQARNLLQMLGLSRYEIPIDSRLTRWLNDFGFPVQLSGAALGDAHYYEFVLDGVQVLCRRAGIKPCVFDAAVFASFDGDGHFKKSYLDF